MNCPNCDREISDSSVFCPFCGSQVGTMEKQKAFEEPYYEAAASNAHSKSKATGFWGLLENSLHVSPNAKKLGLVFYLVAIAFVFELVVFIFLTKSSLSNWIPIIIYLVLIAICLYKPEKFLTLSLVPYALYCIETIWWIIDLLKYNLGFTAIWNIFIGLLEIAMIYPYYLIVTNKRESPKKTMTILILLSVLPLVYDVILILRTIFGSYYYLNFFRNVSEIAFLCVYVYTGYTVEKKRNPDADWARAKSVKEFISALAPGLHENVADKVTSAVHNTPQWDNETDFVELRDEDESE